MSEIRLLSFSQKEEPVEDFFGMPRHIEGLSDNQAKAEQAGTRALLSPTNTYYRTGDSKAFVAFRGETPVGRICAFHNTELVETHGPIGLVGLFTCEDDRTAARTLVDAAAGWCSTRGLKTLRGPMAGDIWHRWRFMTDGFDTPPFPGEPRQPKYYPELFIASGFSRVRTFSTKRITNIESQKERVKTARNLIRKRGYTFRNFDTDRWDEDITSLHVLCQHSFASNWGVTPIAFEEFADIYNRWLTRISPSHILLAEDPDKNVVGLGLAVAAPSDTLNIRTLAVLPGHYGFGLGRAIAAELYQRALDAGQTTVQHCLMGPDAPPQRWDGGQAQVTREYAMFERGIE
ncbi:MAG: GNAT family N-acetyltransferase [Acidobacteriota bacterium]